MGKLSIVLVLVCLLPLPSLAAGKVRLAILDFESRGVEEQTVRTFTDALASELGAKDEYQVISGNEMRSVMSYEASKQMLGCEGDACISQLGHLLDVDRIVSGSLAAIGDGFYVSLSLLDARKAEVISRSSYRVAGGKGELLASVKTAVADLLSLPARLHLTGQINGARIFLDEVMVGEMPVQSLPHRGAGQATLRVEHVDYPPHEQPVTLTSGETTRVQLSMLSYDELSRLSSRRRWTGLSVGLAGAAALAGGAILSLDGWKRKADYDAVDPRSVDQATLDSMGAAARQRIWGGNAALGVGGALLGAGLYLLLHDPYSARLSVSGGGGALVIPF
ncbi:MAG: PEGA domain-containing protein [Deltaproteobacteria bacterium]|nr:PEGA domain-containing protein [Deltaproteobacteria bacterium]